MKRTWLAVVLIGTVANGIALAQEDEDGPGVARISLVSGDVTIQRGDADEWVAAAANAPVVAPDTVATGVNSRAEVQFDYANLVRLAQETEVRLSDLQYRRYQVQVARGTITFSIIRDFISEVDINTPNISVRPLKEGSYRVAVYPDGTTEITVRSGEAEIFSPLGTERLRSGRTMLVRGTAAEPEFQLTAAVRRDEWDQWNEDRDQDLRRRGEAYRYVAADVYGAEDLYGYGRWVSVPDYGYVWSPRVAVGWAPYRYGRWGWTDWYGWTWISYDPWGWAPYHYGRWFHYGSYGWCWWPGGRGRHYWRPAHVAFFGWGGGGGFSVGVGIGFGHVGWVPLAPHERFRPWYGRRYYGGYRNSTYVDNSVNIVNNVNVTNIYRNARVNNAVTAVNGADFGRRGVNNVFGRNGVRLRDASVVEGQLPVVPQRSSLRFSDREVTGRQAAAVRGNFASRGNSRSVERVPFDQQQRGVERVTRQAFSRGADSSRSPRQTAGTAGAANTERATSRGWSRFGESRRSEPSANRAAERPASGFRGSAVPSNQPQTRTQDNTRSSSGWTRFGQANRPSTAAESRG